MPPVRRNQLRYHSNGESDRLFTDGTLFHYIKEGQTDVISLVVADDSLGRR